MRVTEIDVQGYERVARAEDGESGLLAFIAVHDTTLGPAVGGTRVWSYGSEDEALRDVLRLSAGMTWKSAVARTGLGGGKSVVLLRDGVAKTPHLLSAMGRFVEEFHGRYYAAEDVGSTPEDLVAMRTVTSRVLGLPRERGGSGNPSPWTALGVYRGIQACCKTVFGGDDLAGLRVAVQGLGSVGAALCGHLHEAGASLVVSDVRAAQCESVAERYGAEIVKPEDILRVPCDVVAPCALGAVVNDRTIGELRCKIVAGAANNQLDRDEHGELLRLRGILYAPDFVINAGGIINIAVELQPSGYDEAAARERVSRIYDVMLDVLRTAAGRDMGTHAAALEIAQGLVAEGRSAPAGNS